MQPVGDLNSLPQAAKQGGYQMKSALVFTFAAFLLFSSATLCCAAVTGDCVNCHTMHNSQDGSAVAHSGSGAAWNGDGISGGDSTNPLGNLLISGCVGCHSNTGSETIITIGTSKVPIVYNQTEPALPLAGGNFYWVESSGDAYGHNVAGISSSDSALSAQPPGTLTFNAGEGRLCEPCHFDLSIPEAAGWAWGTNNGGCEACHVPRHHANGTNLVVGQEEGWYRFLGSAMFRASNNEMSTPTGVVGIEDDDWEQTVSAADHNVYQGAVGYGNKGAGAGIDEGSIGQICVGCHGQFHHEYAGDANAGSGMTDPSGAWIRHPADILIPATGEYADFNTYNPMTPVGMLNVTTGDANFQNISNSRNVVNCISCHRAHGSPYPDMLRWDYTNDCNANATNANCGCFTCHTAKDGEVIP